MYATSADIAALVGRELSSDEETRAEACISLVSLAADAVVPGIDPDDVPAAVTAVVLAASLRRFLNPGGAMQESIGGYSASHPDAGQLLTSSEMSVLRRATRRIGTLRTPSAIGE